MLADTLYSLRKKKNLSQKELAAIIGVTDKAVSKWETGAAMPKTETILKLAEIFEITTEELLGQAIADKKADANELITLDSLSKLTQNIIFEENVAKSKTDIFSLSPRFSKIYLCIIIPLFICVLIFITVTFINIWDILTEMISTFEIMIAIIFFTAFICGIATGVFYYVKIFMRSSTPIKLLIIFLGLWTFPIITFGGFIMLIPTIIKSAVTLVRHRKELQI